MIQEPTKFCAGCSVTKPLSAFYKSRARVCAECVKAQVRAHRAANLEKVREYDRTRGQMDSRKAANRARYQRDVADPVKKVRYWEQGKRWASKNQTKRKAQILAGNAIRDKSLSRPAACSNCGDRCVPHAHHEDYTKPLEVTWLCKPCHGARHREINAMKRAGVDLTARGF
jgi:hypothetical protein